MRLEGKSRVTHSVSPAMASAGSPCMLSLQRRSSTVLPCQRKGTFSQQKAEALFSSRGLASRNSESRSLIAMAGTQAGTQRIQSSSPTSPLLPCAGGLSLAGDTRVDFRRVWLLAFLCRTAVLLRYVITKHGIPTVHPPPSLLFLGRSLTPSFLPARLQLPDGLAADLLPVQWGQHVPRNQAPDTREPGPRFLPHTQLSGSHPTDDWT